MAKSAVEKGVAKCARGLRHCLTAEGRNALRLAVRHDLAVPLFWLQKHAPRSWLPAPASVNIEITNRCNLNCVMCVRRYWDADANPLGEMTYGFFAEHLLPHLRPSQHVNLQGVGESLVSRNFLPMLEACRRVGCRTSFITNGVALKKHAETLVGVGVDEIKVSIDGTDSMRKMRGVELDTVLEAIDAVNEVKRRAGTARPELYVNYVLTRDSLPELPKLLRLLGPRGVARVVVMHVIVHAPELLEQSVFPVYDRAVGVLDEAAAEAERHGIELELPPPPNTSCRCYQPFRMIYVNWDGTVRPCCMSTIEEDGALRVGTLGATDDCSLPELWNSAYMHSLRRALLDERGMPELCLTCPARVTDLESHTHFLGKLRRPAEGGGA